MATSTFMIGFSIVNNLLLFLKYDNRFLIDHSVKKQKQKKPRILGGHFRFVSCYLKIEWQYNCLALIFPLLLSKVQLI